MIRAFFLSRRVRGVFFCSLFFLWVVTLWALSARSGSCDPAPPIIPQSDKILHFGYFFLGSAFLLLGIWNTTSLRGWKSGLLVVAIIALIGLADEWHQTFVPFREGGDPRDWAADCAGGVTAILMLGWAYGEAKRRQRRAKSS